MSGHNKWSKIKRKKGATDAKRSKIFSKIIKEISVAVKEGDSGDPDFNPRLRLAVANAKGANMPKENVERAIKKATEGGGEQIQELTYEGYAPGGIAIFVECTTDNQNRTHSNVRGYFHKFGGNLATTGSVEFMFDRKGVFVIKQNELDEEELTLELIDSGSEEVELDEGEFTIITDVTDYGNMQNKLEEMGAETVNVELQRIPKTTTQVELSTAKSALKLIDFIEEDEDVVAVYHNMKLTEEILAEIE